MKQYVSKDAETRTREILSAALELFLQKGYDSTSIDDIAGRVGVTKGSIYHHFSSKEAVLEAVVDQLSAGVIKIVKHALAREDLNAVEKINLIVTQTYAYRNSKREQYTRLASFSPIRGESAGVNPPDGPMRKRLFENVLQAVLDPYVAIIRQGVNEGFFNVEYPEEAARFYIRVADLLRDDLAVLATAGTRNAGVQRVRFYEQVLERTLAAPAGSFEFTGPVINFFFPDQNGEK